jgi:type IV secretory pathway component VirB8
LKKRNYEDEYRVIADLTDFENLRSMMEVEAFRRRKTIKEEKKKKKTVCGSLSLFSFLPLIFFVLVCLIPRKDIHT